MRVPVVSTAVLAGALAVLAVGAATCTLPPPPLAGLAQGSTCGTDLDCDDGLVCSCGVCDAPGPVDVPPSCGNVPECPAVPSTCVASCAEPTPIGGASCANGVETCAAGVLESTCEDCGAVPEGFTCVDGELVCVTPGNTGCLTNDCEGQTPFFCVTSCDAAATAADCVDHALACDAPGSFPASECEEEELDAGTPPDAGCGGEARPLCLLDCDPSQPLNAAQCRAEDGGPEDWSCTGFTNYVPADECGGDAGPDAGA